MYIGKRSYVIISAAFYFMACNNGKEATHTENDDAIIVKTETVSAGSLDRDIMLSGNIEGTKTVKLGFMVPGKVECIAFREGQFIAKGQLIAGLDTTGYSLARQLADVKVNAISDEFNRLKFMHSKGSLSESDFSKVDFSLQEARIEQKIQRKNVSDTRLYAPIGGVLLHKYTEVGEIIAAGTPLFEVADIKKVVVAAFVPGADLHDIHLGQTALVSIAALNKTFTGKVTEVGSAADAASRAFTVKMEVENTGLQIKPGMIAEARIVEPGQHAGMLLPAECVMHDLNGQSYVYVADKAQHRAYKRTVSLGNIIENKIEILSGLLANETVVIAGQEKLSDGALIAVN